MEPSSTPLSRGQLNRAAGALILWVALAPGLLQTTVGAETVGTSGATLFRFGPRQPRAAPAGVAVETGGSCS
jgi:hypothetical protein